jgi:glycosyltransferase involved in cell wall biosynthesis
MTTSPSVNRKYKVMHVVEAFGAGVGHCIQQIYSNFAQDLKVVVVHGSRDFSTELAQDSPDVEFVAWCAQREVSPKADLLALRELLGIMSRHRPDIVHAHSSKGGFHGRLAAFLLGIPSVYTPHSYAFLRQDIGNRARFVFRSAERCLAPMALTVACGMEEFAHARCFSRNVVLVENGIDTSLFAPRADASAAPDPCTVVCVGRLSPQKDFPMFEQIAAQDCFSQVQFVWVSGQGGADYAVRSNLQIFGHRSPAELAELFRSATVYLSTSRWEGLSRAVLEAAACGLPLVLRDCPGNRELAFRLPVAVDFGTIQEATQAICDALRERAHYPLHGIANAEMVGQFYSSMGMQTKLRSIYDALFLRKTLLKGIAP